MGGDCRHFVKKGNAMAEIRINLRDTSLGLAFDMLGSYNEIVTPAERMAAIIAIMSKVDDLQFLREALKLVEKYSQIDIDKSNQCLENTGVIDPVIEDPNFSIRKEPSKREPDKPQFGGVTEAAKAIGCSPYWVRSRCKQGKIKSAEIVNGYFQVDVQDAIEVYRKEKQKKGLI